LRTWHLAQLHTTHTNGDAFDPEITLARAKAERMGDPKALGAWLTTGETMAFLNNAALVKRYLSTGS
jgi:hypothetical protein